MLVQIGVGVRIIAALFIVLLAFGLAACGAAGGESDTTEGAAFEELSQSTVADEATGPAATAVPFAASAMEEGEQSISVSSQGSMEEPAEMEIEAEGSTGFFQSAPLSDEAQASVSPQNRIIVRTVDMGIIVPDVPRAAEEILATTRNYGGWQVTSDRSRTHRASLAVRVPAERLDEFVDSVREMSERVEYETSNSQDVTDQYVDNEARLNGLRRTEERLFEFLERAGNIEDALNVQRELAAIQLEMEAIEGRLRFLSQTAAFSLVNLSLTTRPGGMEVEIGQDAATYRAGLSAGFRATFEAPGGVEEFRFTWDFGDGTDSVEGTRTAPTTNPGERVTATVSHTYFDIEQSPYIVQLEVGGIGDAGVFEGSDTLIATVTEIPGIEVFAGENRVVDEGDEVDYSGSFTRPESLWDFEFHWDFGDGSATVVGVPAEGSTRALVAHTYRDYRPDSYEVLLTVTAQSEAGEVKGTGSFRVQVNEVEGFIVAGWDMGGTAKSAVRALTAIGQVLVIVLIWLGILSPVWLAVLAVVLLYPRLRRRFGWNRGDSPAPRILGQRAQSVDDSEPEGDGRPNGPADVPQRDQDADEPQFAEPGPNAIVCNQCGRAIPGDDPIGNPPQYCPFCGADTNPS